MAAAPNNHRTRHIPPADLNGARILLTAPRFFGYDQEIRSELERRGAHVDFFADRPFDSALMHAAARFSRRAVLARTEKRYRALLSQFDDAPYDYVFVLNGQTLPPRLLAQLRDDHPAATFLFYIWDAIANRPGAPALLPFFDRTYSFEPEAAVEHGMRFRPLFFAPRFGRDRQAQDRYDISFVGTAHTDRYRVLQAVDRALSPDTRRFWYLYLQARWVLEAYRLTNPAFRGARARDFRFDTLGPEEGAQVFWESRCMLDIEHPAQTGLTIRTFETIGAGKKLVTTNRNLLRYAFHDPARFAVIDRAQPDIPDRFLQSDTPPMAQTMLNRYSVAGWIDEIFDPGDHSARHLRPGEWTRPPMGGRA
jgi:hypothetical protein